DSRPPAGCRMMPPLHLHWHFRKRRAAMVALMLLLAACKRTPTAVPPDAAPPDAAPPTPPALPIKLLSNGPGSGRSLSYQVPEAQAERMAVHLMVSVTTERVGEENRTVELPPIRVVVDSTRLRSEQPKTAHIEEPIYDLATEVREARFAGVEGIAP